LPVLLGLLAAAFYGAADFFGGLASRRSSIFAVVVISQTAGFVLLCVLLPLFPGHVTPSALLYGFAGGVCAGAGIALLYRALAIGTMGVVSPITAVLAAAVPVMVGIFARGEHLSVWKLAGILVALVAVVLIPLSPGADGRLEFSGAGVREAIASGLALSGFYVFLALAGKDSGPYPLVAARIGSAGLLLLVALVRRRSLVPVRATVPMILCAGALDMTANALYLYAVRSGYLAICAVLTSLYPASTVVLARFVLHERLATVQKLGVGFALLGVVLIAK
jgi:drug/metabolite transporter (DMT)-like permease